MSRAGGIPALQGREDVNVIGSFSYDTQIGGSTTVPLLRVDSVKVL